MEAVCPSCKQIFTPVGGGREPLVITCGDSICNECIAQMSVSYSFICKIFIIQVPNVDSQSRLLIFQSTDFTTKCKQFFMSIIRKKIITKVLQ